MEYIPAATARAEELKDLNLERQASLVRHCLLTSVDIQVSQY